jgi:hypothetical protein
MLEFLTSVLNGKLPEWISAVGALAAVVGVGFVWKQIKLTKEIAQLEFEDGLAKEYRELASRIPTKALLGAGLSPKEYDETFDELFRYIDLSNEQIGLRSRDRIRDETWIQWSQGIKFNMRLPAFHRAWMKIQRAAPTQFSELSNFLSQDFNADPKEWKKEDRQ